MLVILHALYLLFGDAAAGGASVEEVPGGVRATMESTPIFLFLDVLFFCRGEERWGWGVET